MRHLDDEDFERSDDECTCPACCSGPENVRRKRRQKPLARLSHKGLHYACGSGLGSSHGPTKAQPAAHLDPGPECRPSRVPRGTRQGPVQPASSVLQAPSRRAVHPRPARAPHPTVGAVRARRPRVSGCPCDHCLSTREPSSPPPPPSWPSYAPQPAHTPATQPQADAQELAPDAAQ